MAAGTETTPPGVMLAIHQKTTRNVDLYTPLRNYAAEVYSSSSLPSIDDDLKSISTLRSNIQKPPNSRSFSRSSLHAHLSDLTSYHSALLALLPRFPIPPALSFTWYDAYKYTVHASQSNIHFETAAVVFNVGATYSQIALWEDRTVPAGLDAACEGFMSAAVAFGYLSDVVAAKAAKGGGVTVDLTVECAGMLEKLMLAQAHECFFEKAVADLKAADKCSKISRQVGIYYEQACQALKGPALKSHFDKAWVCHLQLKAAYFFAEAYYRIELVLHSKRSIADQIARLKAGIDILADAKKYFAKNVGRQFRDAVNKLKTNMSRELERAVKENNKVYHMRVPTIDSLAELPASSLFIPIAFQEVLNIRMEGLFSSVVPESVAKNLSVYTESVDNIICLHTGKLRTTSMISRNKLEEISLPGMFSLERNFKMPLDLKRDIEDVQSVGGPSGLEAEIQRLKHLEEVNQELLKGAEELLQNEQIEDSLFREQYGMLCSRAASNTLHKNLHERLKKLAVQLSQAADNNARIESSVKENSDMSILNYKPIESAWPPMDSDGEIDDILKSTKQSLSQLVTDGMDLQDMLQEIKKMDDIVPKLMANFGSLEELYKKELTKYHCTCEAISKNVEAQEDLLVKIQDLKDGFLASSKWTLEKRYEQVAKGVVKFREIKSNINEALSSYVTIQDAIEEEKKLCSNFVMYRNRRARE